MKFSISFIPFAVVLALMFVACGDDKSSSANSLPDEVADKGELYTYDCNMSVIGQKVFVTDKGKTYECDGEEWFESYDQPKSSEKGKSSSSSKGKGSSSSVKNAEKLSSSSGAQSNAGDSIGSSTSSSRDGAKSSNSSDPYANIADAKIMPSGTYDCSKYNCITTEFLNQDFLNSNKYGEILDERDGHVYKTVVIYDQVWMAQNLNYKWNDSYDFLADQYGVLYPVVSDSDGVCPKGWRLPSYDDWHVLIDEIGYYGDAGYSLKTQKGWKNEGNGLDEYGFSAAPTLGENSAFYRIAGKSSYMTLSYSSKEFSSSNIKNTTGCNVRCLKDKDYADIPVCNVDGMNSCKYGSLTDERDGRTYKTIKMGHQEWMAENLNFAYPSSADYTDSSSYCYNDSLENCEKYGRLYLWSAAMDSAALYSTGGKNCGERSFCAESPKVVQGVCPSGWHLPSLEEFKILVSMVGGKINANKNLQSTSGWDNGKNGFDTFGFSVLPSGHKNCRYMCETSRQYNYFDMGSEAIFWTSTTGSDNAYAYRSLFEYSSFVKDSFAFGASGRGIAASVRCVKNDD